VPVKSFGPFPGGVADFANPIAVQGKQVLRFARNCRLDGVGRLIVRGGTQLALTLMDDQGGPAPVTSVQALIQFADAALAVGHSTITSKFYLYWLKADLSDWYNSSKVLQGTAAPLPVAVLWSALANPAPVLIAEGLNVAYIAHNGGLGQTRYFDTTVTPATINDLLENLDGTGNKTCFFRGVVSFKQALWGWGYGSQAAGDAVRPELLRFTPPFFAAMAAVDNFAVGHRTRSILESIVDCIVCGQIMYVGTNWSIWPIAGDGRDTWDKSRPIDEAYGFWGLRSACAGPNGYLYYWSHRGPLRVIGYGPPEPLWPRISKAILNIVDNTPLVCVYNSFVDQVQWLYQDQTSGRVSRLVGYDVLREAIVGPDGDVGLGISVMGLIHPITTTVPPGPVGPPTTPSTTGVGSFIATANWVNGDTSPETASQLEYRTPQSTGTWQLASSSIPAGQTSYQLTGLAPGTAYEWRIKHVRNGISSAYLGPSANTQFSTVAQLAPPTISSFTMQAVGGGLFVVRVQWVNSGESGVSTEVYWGPQNVNPPTTLDYTAPPGVSSNTDTAQTLPSNTWYARVRHVKSGFVSSNYSAILSAFT